MCAKIRINMRCSFKRSIGKILVFISICLLSTAVAEVKLPSPSGFVNDYAGVLSAQQKQELDSVVAVLKKKTGAELAVAIVKSVAPLDSKLYAVKLFEKWGIGEKGKDNGVLLLLAMEEKRVEIEVGYGLEGVLTDAVAGRILDTYAVPNFKQGKFGVGVVETAKAIGKVIAGEEVPLAAVPAGGGKETSPFFLVVIIAVIILGAILRKPGSIFAGIFGAIWGATAAGIIGAVFGALAGFFLGFWGIYFMGRGGMGRGGFGGRGFGGFGGGRSGGGGAGRGW